MSLGKAILLAVSFTVLVGLFFFLTTKPYSFPPLVSFDESHQVRRIARAAREYRKETGLSPRNLQLLVDAGYLAPEHIVDPRGRAVFRLIPGDDFDIIDSEVTKTQRRVIGFPTSRLVHVLIRVRTDSSLHLEIWQRDYP
jgi:hypothetical protein